MRRLTALCTGMLCFVAGASWVHADTGAPGAGAGKLGVAAPVYKTERWEEDYTYLKAPAKGNDLFDSIKYIPLNADGDLYLSFGGQVRDRYENFNHNTFGTGTQDRDGYNLARASIYADLHFRDYVRVFAEVRGAFENGRRGGARPQDLDQLDLQQGFVDLSLPVNPDTKFTFRAGRQELQFGAERLIGPADFNNVRRTYDGFRGILQTGGNQLNLFLVRPVAVSKYDFDNANNATVFGGVYETLQLPKVMPKAKTKIEAYGLYLNRHNETYPNSAGPAREIRYTAGARFSSNPKPFDMDIEADYQWGDYKNQDVQAYSLASDFGYTVETTLTPRAFIGFDIASGDRKSSTGRQETFNQLFPTGHTYFGYIDVVGRQNVIDLHPGFDFLLLEKARFAQKVTLRAEYHQFWRQSTTDAVYSAAGTVLRNGASDARSIGSEADLLLKWQVDRHLGTYVGYSHFFHGKFIQETGASKDIDFVYVAATYTF